MPVNSPSLEIFVADLENELRRKGIKLLPGVGLGLQWVAASFYAHALLFCRQSNRRSLDWMQTTCSDASPRRTGYIG